MTNDQKEQMRRDLAGVHARGGLSTLAAVAGISRDRLEQLRKGAEPTLFELSTINMLK